MTCAPAIALNVYNGRDNVETLVLFRDGAVISDLSGVSRVTVDVDGGTTVIDSAVVGSSVIWWTDTTTYRGSTVDVLRLQLGGQSITAGTYTGVEIVTYDATYPNGLRVENTIKMVVI